MRKMSDAEVIGFLKGCGPINLSEAIRRMGPGCSGWCRVVKLAAKAGFDRDAWKKDKRDKIVKYLTAFPDQPQGRIADILGYSRPMVCSIGIAQGIRRKNSKSGVAHPERDATIIAELNKGLSFQKAAVLFSLSKAVVKRIAKRYGTITPNPDAPKAAGEEPLRLKRNSTCSWHSTTPPRPTPPSPGTTRCPRFQFSTLPRRTVYKGGRATMLIDLIISKTKAGKLPWQRTAPLKHTAMIGKTKLLLVISVTANSLKLLASHPTPPSRFAEIPASQARLHDLLDTIVNKQEEPEVDLLGDLERQLENL